MHEPGAEPLAQLIRPLLPEAMDRVAAGQYAPFADPILVHVCATKESFYRLTGHRSAAVVTTKLFLSPALFDGSKPLDRYLAHELSHLHLRQRLGVVASGELPSWFKEGLAELVSGGATGAAVPEGDAYRAVSEGRCFLPDEGRDFLSNALFPRYGGYWNLDQRMYYRQCMLFVGFMRDRDEGAFKRLLLAVQGGDSFKKALENAYRVPLSSLWDGFLKHSEAMVRQGQRYKLGISGRIADNKQQDRRRHRRFVIPEIFNPESIIPVLIRNKMTLPKKCRDNSSQKPTKLILTTPISCATLASADQTTQQ